LQFSHISCRRGDGKSSHKQVCKNERKSQNADADGGTDGGIGAAAGRTEYGFRVLRVPPVNGAVVDRNIDDGEQREYRGESCSLLAFGKVAAKHQVADEGQIENQLKVGSRISCPPDVPCQLAPDDA